MASKVDKIGVEKYIIADITDAFIDMYNSENTDEYWNVALSRFREICKKYYYHPFAVSLAESYIQQLRHKIQNRNTVPYQIDVNLYKQSEWVKYWRYN